MRIFNPGDPDPGDDVNVVQTEGGNTFKRNQHGRWCNAIHADNVDVITDPNHLGTSWEFLTGRCGPITAEENKP